MEFYKAKFSMDSFDDNQPNIDGMTYGGSWNGWACPYFTFENAMIVVDQINQDQEYCNQNQLPISILMYSKCNDTFYYIADDQEPECIDAYEGMMIDGVKYYPIGNCSWCWHEMSERE